MSPWLSFAIGVVTGALSLFVIMVCTTGDE